MKCMIRDEYISYDGHLTRKLSVAYFYSHQLTIPVNGQLEMMALGRDIIISWTKLIL